MVLSLRNSKSGREEKDHSVIHAIEEAVFSARNMEMWEQMCMVIRQDRKRMKQ